MEVSSYTPDEADASLMKEAGLSYDEVAGLNLYWKRLMMGYREPRQRTMEDAMPAVARMLQRARNVAEGGWRTM